MTGLTNLAPEQSGKRLQILKEAVPGISRIATLWNAANPAKQVEFRQLQAAAEELGVQIRSLEVRSPDDFDAALEAVVQERPDALVVLQDGLVSDFMPKRLADIATKNRLPTMGESIVFANAGGMMAYGVSAIDLHRRAASYVDKILKGAKPADLPVEQPTVFDFVINLKTAQALGLSIPSSVLQQATEVIQ